MEYSRIYNIFHCHVHPKAHERDGMCPLPTSAQARLQRLFQARVSSTNPYQLVVCYPAPPYLTIQRKGSIPNRFTAPAVARRSADVSRRT